MLSSSYSWRNWILEVISAFLPFNNWIFSLIFFLCNIFWYTWISCYPSFVLKGLFCFVVVVFSWTCKPKFWLLMSLSFWGSLISCSHECLGSPLSFHSLFYISKKLPVLKCIRWEQSQLFLWNTCLFPYRWHPNY